MNWLIPFGFLASLLYLLHMARYKRDWDRLSLIRSEPGEAAAGVSVVIAFRNEADHLPALLQALAAQNYPRGCWEVILVDDHSVDGSADLVREFIPELPQFRLLSCTEGEGKKAALLTGVGQVRFPFVVTTDADCIMGPSWLTAIGSALAGEEHGIVMGPVMEEQGEGFFSCFSRIEFLSLVASGAAAAAGGRPVFCNGANLAYPVSLFRSFPDPMGKAWQSGDDTLFMLQAKHRGVSVRFLKNPDAFVYTRAPEGWKAFFSRRVRWAGKPAMYTDGDVVRTALLVTLSAVVLFASLVAALAGGPVWLFPALIIVKYMADVYFLQAYAAFCKIRLPYMRMLGYEAVYPFYIIWVILLGMTGRNSWKGRTNRSGFLFSFRVRKGI